jgi:hypothetical protein
MQYPPDPISQLPRPAEVHAHIGQLLIELRFARRLFRLIRAAESIRLNSITTAGQVTAPPDRREVANA